MSFPFQVTTKNFGNLGSMAEELGIRPGILEAYLVRECSWEGLSVASHLPGARKYISTARALSDSVTQQGVGQSSNLEAGG